jgi:hypothetical protein
LKTEFTLGQASHAGHAVFVPLPQNHSNEGVRKACHDISLDQDLLTYYELATT